MLEHFAGTNGTVREKKEREKKGRGSVRRGLSVIT
jgi:stalled ribosome alternative rescue factor ArfA